jgi:hypothetical protein
MDAWECIKHGLYANPKDMKMNLMASQIMVNMEDRAKALIYLREARRNAYIGQEQIVVNFQKDMFGMDIDYETELINKKVSNRTPKERDSILKIHKMLNQ